MSEVSCQNCPAACCKGLPLLTMALSDEEFGFMKAPGNIFLTIAEAVDYDRTEVLYPTGIAVYPDRGTFRWIAEEGRPYEPLAAGLGRHALCGACKYLTTDETGWEHCGAYDERPEVCRAFEVGSEKCLQLRAIALAA